MESLEREGETMINVSVQLKHLPHPKGYNCREIAPHNVVELII